MFLPSVTELNAHNGRKSLFANVYSMRTSKDFVSTLQDVIRRRRAMDKLISDRGSEIISEIAKEVLRLYTIGD